jgi:SMODS-associated NUDIX domain
MTAFRVILYVLTFSISLYVLIRGSVPYNEIAAAIIATFILLMTDKLYDNTSRLRYLYYSIRYFNMKVRVSISYLYRIKVGEMYLLVRSQRRKDQFQPVGGVIKALPDGKTFLTSIKAKEDDFIPIDDDSKNDLRITIDGRNIFTLMTWYETATGRETDCWREFYEELLATKILSLENFGYVYTRHLKRHLDPISYGNPEQKHRFLVSEIYELLPTDNQTK